MARCKPQALLLLGFVGLLCIGLSSAQIEDKPAAKPKADAVAEKKPDPSKEPAAKDVKPVLESAPAKPADKPAKVPAKDTADKAKATEKPLQTAADSKADTKPKAAESKAAEAAKSAPQDPVKLEEKIKEAEEAQEFREEAAGPVLAQIVQEAPAADLASGDADISTTGNCALDVDNFCSKVQPGEGRLAECLSKEEEQESKGNVEGRTLTEDCKEELAAFKIDRATNINKDLALASACKEDAKKLCKKADPKNPAAVLICLREHKDKLSETCSKEVLRTQTEAAQDYRADAELHKYCIADAEKLCKDVEPGEGRVQACLRTKPGQLHWECAEELFRQEMENADNILLNVVLLRKCMGDKKKFCDAVEPGQSRVKACLEEHRNDNGFSAECKAEFEAMMERRAADFRLDAQLRKVCASDIETTCGYEKASLETVEGFDARVIECLQDFRDSLQSAECQAEVHKVSKRAAQDIRFDEPLADACFEDREKYCSGVQPGSARVIRCLQDKREMLSPQCRAGLFDQEVRMAEDIDFKYPMRQACATEIAKFCGSIKHGHSRIIRCLQEHVEDTEMGSDCRAEVEGDSVRSSHDFRLKSRLHKACKEDVKKLCKKACQMLPGQSCGGRVLRCLTDNQDKIESKECQDEVFYFEKMEVNDFRNDVILAEACRSDVEKFCAKTEPGEGRVHACLREHRQQLHEECRKEELKLNIIQARDIRLRPKLVKLCSEEIAIYCKKVQPGKGRVFKCLQENLAKPDFGTACRQEMSKREERMQEDYRLDAGVADACHSDIMQLCREAQGQAHGKAEVLKCLVAQHKSLSLVCQDETSRAVRMALWDYKPGAALTEVCDYNVEDYCADAKAQRSRGVWSIGAIGRCLSKQLAQDQKLESRCRTLMLVAAPKDARDIIEKASTAQVLAQRVKAMQDAAGIKTPLVNPQKQGIGVITLHGYMALAAMLAVCAVMVLGASFAYTHYMGLDQPYEMVTKEGDV